VNPDLFSSLAIQSNRSDFTTQELRDEAIERAETHASPEWKADAYRAIEDLCVKRREFTSDDLWGVIEMPKEPRALGGVFRRAQKAGICRHGGYVKSERRGGITSKWISCLS
jgi:hypothetical protein